MPVAFDNTANVRNFTVTTVTTPAFTISSGPNTAALLLFTSGTKTLTAFTGDVGGSAAAQVANTAIAGSAAQNVIFGLTNPPSGSKTATMSWTTASADANLICITATGVDQTTSFNNGNTADSAGAVSFPITITSVAGDLTSTVVGAGGPGLETTDQIQKYGPVSSWGADIGQGLGTTTHTWTMSSSGAWTISGANFKQAPGGASWWW